jgi:signal transduction histidine kinase/ActR/RegA family two-component response regulator
MKNSLLKKIQDWALKNINREDIPLAVQLATIVIILANFCGSIATVIKLLEGVPLASGIIMAGTLAMAGILYVICIKFKKNKLGIFLCYFFGCMVCIPYTFLVGGGISSGLIAYFVLSLVLIVFMFHDNNWIPITILQIMIFIACIGVSYFFPDFIEGPESRKILHLDNIQGVLICGLTIGGLIKFQIWAYQLQKEKADAASRAKADFLATMSHEIRTPMNAIIGLQDSILREHLTDTQIKYMNNLRVSSFALLDIVNNILDFSKIDAGGIVITEMDFDLSVLLGNIATLTEMGTIKKDLAFKTRFDPALPRYIKGDETKLRQILNNLLSNAVKYTPRGSVEFCAELRRNSGDTADDVSETLCFEVRDTGIGIKDEDKDRIFSPFEQLDLQKNKGILGTGLGLTITKKLCAAMGGSIELESVYGEGTVFRVLLPCRRSEAMEQEAADEKLLFFVPSVQVLVVDDVDINLMVAEAMLNEFSIVPDTALSGPEALLKAAATEYDLIFMDQMMPQMDGIKTTAELRKLSDHYAHVPVIALTANVMNTSEDYFKDLGFNAYLSKPIEKDKLVRCLTRYLGDKAIS